MKRKHYTLKDKRRVARQRNMMLVLLFFCVVTIMAITTENRILVYEKDTISSEKEALGYEMEMIMIPRYLTVQEWSEMHDLQEKINENFNSRLVSMRKVIEL